MSKIAVIQTTTKYDVIDPEDGQVLESYTKKDEAKRAAIHAGLSYDYRENIAYDSIPSYTDIIDWVEENWDDIHELITGTRPYT